MASTNTEKPIGKAQKAKVVVAKTPKKNEVKAPIKTVVKKTQEIKSIKKITKVEEKKKVITTPKVKKDEVKVNGKSIISSTKVAAAICKFIKRKTVAQAIIDLELVTLLKKAVPMKGEIPHRKGKIMSGRFPERAAKEFLVLVRSLEKNADNVDIENPVIVTAIANKPQRPYAKGGRARKKRSHVLLVAKEKKVNKKVNKKQ